MKQEIAKQWVAALRSGNYRQTYGRLAYEDKYCVLGVLADISGIGEWTGRPLHYKCANSCDYGVLPEDVVEWAGLSGTGENGDAIDVVVGLNDDGSHFDYIAEYIEQNWEAL